MLVWELRRGICNVIFSRKGFDLDGNQTLDPNWVVDNGGELGVVIHGNTDTDIMYL